MTAGPVFATEKHFEIADEFPDPFKEALHIVRGQTMMLPTKKHLEAVSLNRDELLVTLNRALGLLNTFVKEVEIITGRLGPTRELVADLQKRYDIEVAA